MGSTKVTYICSSGDYLLKHFCFNKARSSQVYCLGRTWQVPLLNTPLKGRLLFQKNPLQRIQATRGGITCAPTGDKRNFAKGSDRNYFFLPKKGAEANFLQPPPPWPTWWVLWQRLSMRGLPLSKSASTGCFAEGDS